MLVSILILTYNSSSTIEKCILGLVEKYNHKFEDNLFELLVADNASLDNTREILKKFKGKKNIHIYENKENLGFAAGMNYLAAFSKANSLLFLNPDTQIIDLKLDEMDSYLTQHENVGILGGTMVKTDGQKELSAGSFYSVKNTILLSLGVENIFDLRRSPKNIQAIDFVSGGFMFIKKQLFEKLGGFDTNYFMYMEDLDLCLRARKLGFLTVFYPQAKIKHIGQGSSNREFAIVNIYKGLLYYHKKNSSPIGFLLVKLALKLKAFGLIILGRISNNTYLVSTYEKAYRLC